MHRLITVDVHNPSAFANAYGIPAANLATIDLLAAAVVDHVARIVVTDTVGPLRLRDPALVDRTEVCSVAPLVADAVAPLTERLGPP